MHAGWPGLVLWTISKAASPQCPLAAGWAQQGGSRAKVVTWIESRHGLGLGAVTVILLQGSVIHCTVLNAVVLA